MLLSLKAPLVETDPAVLDKAETAVDAVAHLGGSEDADGVAEIPRFPQRRERYGRPDAPSSGGLDGGDAVDAGDPGSEEQRGRCNGPVCQSSEVEAPRSSEPQPTEHLFDPPGLYRSDPESRSESGGPLREPGLVAYRLDHEIGGKRRLFRQRREVYRHPDVVATVLEAVRHEARAKVGWAHRRSHVPGAGNVVRPHSFDGSGDLPVCLFTGQVGISDTIEVVDGGVADGPTYPPVV